MASGKNILLQFKYYLKQGVVVVFITKMSDVESGTEHMLTSYLCQKGKMRMISFYPFDFWMV